MKVAVVGSRGAKGQIAGKIVDELPKGCTEIVSGGAAGVDSIAEMVAKKMNIPLKVFLPDYDLYGKMAPLIRNAQIVDYADFILAFWDFESTGTQHIISECIKKNKKCKIIEI